MQVYRQQMSDEKKHLQREKARVRMKNMRMLRKQQQQQQQQPQQRRDNTAPPVRTASSARQLTVDRIRRQLGEDTLEFLNDDIRVLEHLEQRYANINTRGSTIAHIVGYCKRIDATIDLSKYRARMMQLIQQRDEEYATNKLSSLDVPKWVDWSTILSKEPVDKFSKVVYDLYTKLPPRHCEYRELICRRSGSVQENPTPDTTRNYVDMDGDGGPCRIVLNVYKGSKKKGQYICTAPKSLVEYINNTDALDGDYVFPRARRSPSGWSRCVGNVFQKLLGRRATVNVLRKSYATHCFQSASHMSEATKKNIALSMGTSVLKLQGIYRKI